LRKDYLADGDKRCVIGTIVQEPRQIRITSSACIYNNAKQTSKETTAKAKVEKFVAPHCDPYNWAYKKKK
jgi:hypothetical protein